MRLFFERGVGVVLSMVLAAFAWVWAVVPVHGEPPRVGVPYLVTGVDGGEELQSSSARGYTGWRGMVYFTNVGWHQEAVLWRYVPGTGALARCDEPGLGGWLSLEVVGVVRDGLLLIGIKPGVGSVLLRYGADGSVSELGRIGIAEDFARLARVGVVDGRVFFRVDGSQTGSLMMSSDGTAAGTRVIEISSPQEIASIVPLGDGALLCDYERTWISDGTTARVLGEGAWGVWSVSGAEVVSGGKALIGTRGGLRELDLVTGEVVTRTDDVVNSGPVVLGDAVVYWAENLGLVSWSRSAGGAARTLVAASGEPVVYRVAGGRAVVAIDGSVDVNAGVWSTDGTIEGTERLIVAGAEWVNWETAGGGGAVWACRRDGFTLAELIGTDGTQSGTVRAEEPIWVSSWSERPTVVGGSLYMSTDPLARWFEKARDTEPWRVDDRGRTGRIADLAPARARGLALTSDHCFSDDRLWVTASTDGWATRAVVTTRGEPGDLRVAARAGLGEEVRLIGPDGAGGAFGDRRNWMTFSRTLVRWHADDQRETVLGEFPYDGTYEALSFAYGDGMWLFTDGASAVLTDGTVAGTRVMLEDSAGEYDASGTLYGTAVAWTGSWFAISRARFIGAAELWKVTPDAARLVTAWPYGVLEPIVAFGGRVWRSKEDLGNDRGVWQATDGEGPFVDVRDDLPGRWRYAGAAAGRWVVEETNQYGQTVAVWKIDEGDVSLASMRRVVVLDEPAVGVLNDGGLVNGRLIVNNAGSFFHATLTVDVVTGEVETLPVEFPYGYAETTGREEVAVVQSWGQAGDTYWVTDGSVSGLRQVPDGAWGLWRESWVMGVARGRMFFEAYVPGLGRQIVAVNLCAGDFSGDGLLDGDDLAGFVAAFENGGAAGGSGDGVRADVNGDGFVDWFDFEAFVGDFEAGC